MKPAFRRACPNRNKNFYSFAEARSYIGTLEEGIDVLGVTKGQFSLVDIIKAVIEQTGPCFLHVSTWTAGEFDAFELIDLVESETVTGLRWIIDTGFVNAQPRLAEAICKNDDSIRIFNTHAKFIVFEGGKIPVVLRTSMNLNANPRMEFFEISCCPEMSAWFIGIVDAVYASPAGKRVKLADIQTIEPDPILTLFGI